jgi:NitT/TauT family transport system substrate-binding protein
MTFPVLRVAVSFCLLLAGTPASRTPTPAPKQRVRLAVGSKPGNLVYLPLDLARALNYFAEEGLDVEFTNFDGGTDAALSLAAGHADFSGNSIDHAIKLRSAGKDLKMIVSFTTLPTVTLVIRRDLKPQIQAIQDLKGRRLGVTAIGAGTHVLAASILKKAGCSLADVQVVAVGSGPRLIQALKSGQVDAAMATDPTTTELLMSGDASLLLDMVTFEETQRIFTGEYQFTGLLTRPDLIATRPQLVQSVVNVIVRANRFIATHSAADIAARLPAGIVRDRYIYVKSLEHSRPSFSKDGLVTRNGVANNIQSQITFGLVAPPAGSLEPTSFFDMHYVLSTQGR